MVNYIDKQIDNVASYLQRKNNLDHIAFLKVRLGLQVVVNNAAKTIVTYGFALLLNIFLYTLIVHLSYFMLRRFSHGAHAKSSLLCHVQSVVLFVLLPWLISHYDISSILIYGTALICMIIVIRYAPAATIKQPIPQHLRRGKKIKSIIATCILIFISIWIPQPYQYLIILGILLQAVSLLPIFFPKEE